MKLLVFSDIHNNVEAVRALRAEEPNDYDAVLLAGDLGSDCADSIFEILDTFDCPVFCVYGNWDNKLSYRSALSKHCRLVHDTVHDVKGYFFTGYSGCPTHWGLNPIYLEELAATQNKHAGVLRYLQAAKEAHAAYATLIEEEFKKRWVALLKRKPAVGLSAHRKAGAKLREWKARKLEHDYRSVSKVLHSVEYQSFVSDSWACGQRTAERQRSKLLETIASSRAPHDRLIVITHERLFRFAEDGASPLLHVFGHKHQFKFTTFKGTHYLNAAALDTSSFVPGEGWTSTPGGYCILTLSGHGLQVVRKTLKTGERYPAQAASGQA